MNIKARLIYALHMVLPLSFAALHFERLDAGTLGALRSLFPPL